MKKSTIVTMVVGYAALVVIVTYGTVTFLSHLEKRNWSVPRASEMAKVAVEHQQASISFQELEKRVTASIRVDAKKGARTTSVYIEEFNDNTINEIERILAFRGYKTNYEWSAFAKTQRPDFLEINW
jgi:hypothetical protein